MRTVQDPASSVALWERSYQRVEEWAPYATLVLSTALSIADGGEAAGTRIVTVALACLAGGWVLVAYSRLPAARRQQGPWMALYMAGLLSFAGLLMARDPVFFLFGVTGFLHAALLRPPPAVFLGTGTTSVLLHTVAFPPERWSLEVASTVGLVVLLQTFLIGFGAIGGQKLVELSEKRRQAVLRMEATLEENAGLHAQLVAQAREAGINDERQRMAREIHDTIAQGLIGVITQLEAAGQAQREDDRRRHLDNAAALARQSLAEARRSVHALGPEPLDDRSLPEAVQNVVRRWSDVHGVTAAATTTGTPAQLHEEVEATCLRLVQESLANVAKHARATRVGVTLSYMGDVVAVDVRDDGVGFATSNGAAVNRGFGLTAMHQRVHSLGGTLHVESEPGAGTAISATIPVDAPGPEDADAVAVPTAGALEGDP